MSSVQFVPPRVVRQVKSSDLEPLKKALPQGPPDKHAARFARQQQGEAVYLLAAQEDVPVAHVLLKWNGAGGDTPAAVLENVPDIEDLYVDASHRRRRVATRLMDEAERLAAARGYTQIGLSCGAANTTALALYVKRGYRDADLGTFRLSGTWTDEKGETQSWEEECVYLLRPLGATAKASAVSEAVEQRDGGGTVMADNGTVSEEEKGNAGEPTPGGEPPVVGQAQQAGGDSGTADAPVTADRLVDFAFGVALTAAETLEKVVNQAVETAKQAQEKAPSFFGEMQEKGRPAREKLVRDLRGDSLKSTVQNVAEKAADVVTSAGKANFKSAEDEIRALEDRVKSLEQEVVARQTVEPPAAAEAPPVVVEPAADQPYAVAEPDAEAGPAWQESDVETGEVSTAADEESGAKPKTARKKGKKSDTAAAEETAQEGGESDEA